MQTKAADDRQPDLDALDALLVRPDVDAATRKRIEREIKAIRAGVAGERDAAYEIEFHYGKSQNRVTLHDLRLEVDGRVAQIDHLMISRLMIVWVCESKHFSEGVSVNDHGEWNGWFGGRPYGIPSPVEQNRRHIAVLKDVFDQGLIELPRRLGITLRPELRSLVLVSNGARISRPKSKAAAAAAGLDKLSRPTSCGRGSRTRSTICRCATQARSSVQRRSSRSGGSSRRSIGSHRSTGRHGSG